MAQFLNLTNFIEDTIHKIGVSVDKKLDGINKDGLSGDYKDLVDSNKLFGSDMNIEGNIITLSNPQWELPDIKKYEQYTNGDVYGFINGRDNYQPTTLVKFSEKGMPEIPLKRFDKTGTLVDVVGSDLSKNVIYLVKVDVIPSNDPTAPDQVYGILYSMNQGSSENNGNVIFGMDIRTSIPNSEASVIQLQVPDSVKYDMDEQKVIIFRLNPSHTIEPLDLRNVSLVLSSEPNVTYPVFDGLGHDTLLKVNQLQLTSVYMLIPGLALDPDPDPTPEQEAEASPHWHLVTLYEDLQVLSESEIESILGNITNPTTQTIRL